MTESLYTIDVNSPNSRVDMMKALVPQRLRLKMYRFKLDYTGIAVADEYDSLYLDISNVVTKDRVIDNNVGVYRFPLALGDKFRDTTTNLSVTSKPCDIVLNMTGPLEISYDVRVWTKNGVLLDANVLKHAFLQFETEF